MLFQVLPYHAPVPVELALRDENGEFPQPAPILTGVLDVLEGLHNRVEMRR